MARINTSSRRLAFLETFAPRGKGCQLGMFGRNHRGGGERVGESKKDSPNFEERPHAGYWYDSNECV
jgi:hypothetical protein